MPDPDKDELESDLEFEIVVAYTRAQAIKDGVLMDVTETGREMGIKIPVAMTHAAWARYVLLTPAAQQAGNDERGRLWDVLWMFRWAIARTGEQRALLLSLRGHRPRQAIAGGAQGGLRPRRQRRACRHDHAAQRGLTPTAASGWSRGCSFSRYPILATPRSASGSAHNNGASARHVQASTEPFSLGNIT